ncbi:MAG: hypothetical protein DHS20C11_06330 [Lysobacteraceae bacterium]|nr:MAG: hypothetical protein DHS20C11_06330 [Xanthomonadaceae bacterium]
MTPQNPVFAWRQKGKIYLWRYEGNEKNYPGYHFATNKSGLASFRVLLGALLEAKLGANRTIRLEQPTRDILAVPNNTRGRAVSRERLGIEKGAESQWQVIETTESVKIVLGEKWITEFTDMLKLVKPQVEPSVGPKGSTRVNLWW